MADWRRRRPKLVLHFPGPCSEHCTYHIAAETTNVADVRNLLVVLPWRVTVAERLNRHAYTASMPLFVDAARTEIFGLHEANG